MPVLTAKGAEQKAWLKDRNKFVSGYCNEHGKPGQHEGTKPKSGSVPLPTCPFWLECPCECHWNVDQMFKITGLERQVIPNPEYVHEPSEFIIPDDVEDPLGTVAVTVTDTDAPPDPERPVGTQDGPSTAPLAQRRTPTGRAARGGLEAQVWEACRSIEEEPLTPKLVGEFIAEKYTIPMPSSGAINAVWDRWTKLGFAEQGKKPNRFVKFTGDGTWEELVRLKGSTKRQAKAAATAAKRGSLRPRKRPGA